MTPGRSRIGWLPRGALRLALTCAIVAGLPTAAANAATITVNTTADELNTDGDCSLREAVQAANTNTAVSGCSAGTGGSFSIDTIALGSGVYNLALAGAGENLNQTGDLDVASGGGIGVTLVGDPMDPPIIDANDIDRAIHVTSSIQGTGSFVRLDTVRIRDGRVAAAGMGGGGVFAERNLTVKDSEVTSNVAVQGWGGGIGSPGGATQLITVINSEISANEAGRGGGGVATLNDTGAPPPAVGGALTVTDSVIADNVAGTDAVFSGVTRGGGGVMTAAEALVIQDSTVAGNKTPGASRSGGGIFLLYAPQGAKELTGSEITGNETGAAGGGIAVFASPGQLTIADSAIEQNRTSTPGSNGLDDGGGIYYNTIGSLRLKGVRVGNNFAEGPGASHGGGLYVGANASASILESKISLNDAVTPDSQEAQGGGIYTEGDLRIERATVVNNDYGGTGALALRSGAGIYVEGAGTELDTVNATIGRNHAKSGSPPGRGGGIFLQGSTARLRYTTVAGNFGGASGVTSFGDQLAEVGGGQFSLGRTIVDGPAATICSSDGAGFASVGANVASGTGCGSPAGDDAFGVDPMLGSLALHGGPPVAGAPGSKNVLQTYDLQPGSPAIERVSGGCVVNPSAEISAIRVVDQRSFPTPFGPACDAGAYERVTCAGEVVGFGSIAGTTGGDALTGGGGADLLVGFGGADTIAALEGDDTVCAGGGGDTVSAGPGDDRGFGQAGADVLRGAGGSDTLNGGGGKDTLKGGKAADLLRGAGGRDLLVGQAGKDKLNGGKAADVLRGAGGRDKLRGGPGGDTLRGGPGKDVCRGGGGNDTAIGCEVVTGVP